MIALLLLLQSAPAQSIPPDIVIEGRRERERYRLPQAESRAPAARDGATAATDPRLACHNVGPLGCGTATVPIVTVGGDGVVLGTPDEGRAPQ